MKKVVSIALLLLTVLVSANAQNQQQGPVKIESKTLISGDTLTLKIDFNVQEDWMVYDSLADDRGPIPLSFNNDAVLNMELIKINKPKTKHKYDDIFEVDLWYFTNKVSYELCFIGDQTGGDYEKIRGVRARVRHGAVRG